MSQRKEKSRRRSVRLTTVTTVSCPSCHAHLTGTPSWCPQCSFTGGDTMTLFSHSPPPLPPVLDASGLWNEKDLKSIHSHLRKIQRRFPQFHWKICTVNLEPSINLNLFSFWLLNASPLTDGETPADRAWTVLLLIETNSGNATVSPGYSAEAWLSEQEWRQILVSMWEPWAAGKTVKAVAAFLSTAKGLLQRAWQRNHPNRFF